MGDGCIWGNRAFGNHLGSENHDRTVDIWINKNLASKFDNRCIVLDNNIVNRLLCNAFRDNKSLAVYWCHIRMFDADLAFATTPDQT